MLYDNGNESGIPNQVVFNASCFQYHIYIYTFNLLVNLIWSFKWVLILISKVRNEGIFLLNI